MVSRDHRDDADMTVAWWKVSAFCPIISAGGQEDRL